ncbi:cation transporter [Herbidospora cretacea]|uniref:cation transporter n=1 Tax=Herbidospora cretacea TaxID=28444 RepID=UPI0007742E39|nr:cation transporter [Herbidospora cretacea]
MPDQRTLTRPAVVVAESWLRDARRARLLSVATLGWLGAESLLGVYAGWTADSAALLGWGLAALVEALASLVVLWRFTGDRLLSPFAERRATRAVAVSFWLLAPYLVVHVLHDLGHGHRAAPTGLGVAVTTISLVSMPVLGWAKRRVGARLASAATTGEGTQNVLCGITAAGVLAGLGAASIGWWWADPLVALTLAGIAVYEGGRAWRGHVCDH